MGSDAILRAILLVTIIFLQWLCDTLPAWKVIQPKVEHLAMDRSFCSGRNNYIAGRLETNHDSIGTLNICTPVTPRNANNLLYGLLLQRQKLAYAKT